MASVENANNQDVDFLYYLDFSIDYQLRLNNQNERNICKLWLEKLSKEPAYGAEARKVRNLWLSHLVICIQEGRLSSIFLTPPDSGPLPDYPNPPPKNIETPTWLENVASEDTSGTSRDGRTYLATKKLDDGRGAFAYLAVTLNDGEPEWLPQAGRETVEQALSHGFEYALGNLSQPDLATVLASRKTLDQRAAVFDYYNNILANITSQLGGSVAEGSCDTVNDLINRLVSGLKKDGTYKRFLKYSRRERYFRLLEILARKIQRRVYRIERRELLLDDIENHLLGDSLFSETFNQEDRVPWTGAEWWHEAPFKTSKDRMRIMEYLYPPELVEAFSTLLEKEKVSVGDRIRRQHINLVAQLNEDLRREQRAGEVLCDDRRAEVSELEAALAVCDLRCEKQEAISPTARKLIRDIAETEILQLFIDGSTRSVVPVAVANDSSVGARAQTQN